MMHGREESSTYKKGSGSVIRSQGSREVRHPPQEEVTMDISKHLTHLQQLQYIKKQQLINSGLARAEENDAARKVTLAQKGRNDLIVNRYTQEELIAHRFALWRMRDAISKEPVTGHMPQPPRVK